MAEDLDRALLEHVRSNPGVTIKALAEVFRQVHANTLRNRLGRLVDAGEVVVRALGRELRYELAQPEQVEQPPARVPTPEPPLFDAQRGLRKEDQAADSDPVRRTANFMHTHLRVGRASTHLANARDLLLAEDARELFCRCINALVKDATESGDGRRKRAAERALKSLQASLGIGRKTLFVSSRGSSTKLVYDQRRVEDHVADRVMEGTFLGEVLGSTLPDDRDNLMVSGSAVSQHWGVVHLPTTDDLIHIRVAFPIVVHNAAAIVKLGTNHQERNDDQPWKTYFVPKLVGDCRRWMMVDPETLYEYDENRRKRLCMSSMDNGQYFIEADQMLKGDFTPDVHFREGRIFPNDCFSANAREGGQQGAYVREAIRRMNIFLTEAADAGTLVCGVAKTTTAACFGPVLDWYIREHVAKDWVFADSWPADNIWMTHLLADESFDGSFRRTLVSCGVRRTMRDVSDVSPTRYDDTDDDQLRELQKLREYDPKFADAFERALNTSVVMFFAGHARRAEMRLPRYEYHWHDRVGGHDKQVKRMLDAMRFSGLITDTVTDVMTSESLRSLQPSVVLYAHDNAKAVGERLTLDVKQEIQRSLRTKLSTVGATDSEQPE